jgi:hypothetical protein
VTAFPGPDLIAFLNAALADGTVDLQRAVDDYIRTAAEPRAEHAGNSLVAWLDHDNHITELQEMPTWEAEALLEMDTEGPLVIASWPAGGAS